uniref:Serine/threonine-protein phosphatase n=1 Tax=Globisporangium ultimum (strain ATCC 200006 / CBS 805.95 / DAOM BR144) TaxID=431595 RepID=K3X434_GLOUD
MPRDQAKGVADRVAAAFADPVLSLPYLHSIQFGADLVELSAQVSNLLETEARCLSISSPVYVFGDIHGNFTDLRFFADNMWHLGMGVTPGSFLFLGDYVDRGQSSLECIAYLLAQKVLHPKKLFLLRGNHETRAINGLEAHYGSGCFLSQCKARFGNEEGYIVWHQINHAFDRLPLAAAIDNDIFCVHGGIPRSVGNEKILDSIHKIPSKALLDVLDMKYYEENSQISMVSDMLWGDPVLEEMESSLDGKGFGKSARGGVAVSFGEKAIENFLQQSKFSRILRAHEAKVDGVA